MSARKIKLTPAQRRLLQQCANDGLIEIGGPDATPGARRDVVARLAQLRLIEYATPPITSPVVESAWRITPEGRALLANNSAATERALFIEWFVERFSTTKTEGSIRRLAARYWDSDEPESVLCPPAKDAWLARAALVEPQS